MKIVNLFWQNRVDVFCKFWYEDVSLGAKLVQIECFMHAMMHDENWYFVECNYLLGISNLGFKH